MKIVLKLFKVKNPYVQDVFWDFTLMNKKINVYNVVIKIVHIVKQKIQKNA